MFKSLSSVGFILAITSYLGQFYAYRRTPGSGMSTVCPLVPGALLKLRFHGAFCPLLAKYSSHRSGLHAAMEVPLLLVALGDATNILLATDKALHGNAA